MITADATGWEVSVPSPPGRVVSLVPSISETVHAVGAADRLVGVTDYCVWPPGAFAGAERVRGTKNPDVDRVLELEPDLVLANLEENRERDVVLLREAGVTVHVSYPRTVRGAATTIRDVAALIGAEREGEVIASDVERARAAASQRCGDLAIPVLCPIWRRPWMAIGEGCYAADLLATCGLATRPAGGARYPRVDPDDLRREVVAVLLPSEPYPFRTEHLAEWEDWDVPIRLVDGALLTWHGPRTVAALETFTSLAHDLADEI
jgi:ABC-type Fe3+-hydroxamate transport system substrate-binding protein